jgi:hypothetical protein
MMYLDLDDRRLAYWERWTADQCEGAVVRKAAPDHQLTPRERVLLFRTREQIADRLSITSKLDMNTSK